MSECIPNTAATLYCKIALMNFQVDFGNLAVGIGTVCVAFATWHGVRRNERSSNDRIRNEFVEQIRSISANLLGVTMFASSLRSQFDHLVSNNNGSAFAQQRVAQKNDEIDKTNEKITTLVSQLILMIDNGKAKNDQLIAMAESLANSAIHNTPELTEIQKQFASKMKEFLLELQNKTRSSTETER